MLELGDALLARNEPFAGELVPIGALWHAVTSYPTVSEVWLRLLEALEGCAQGRVPDGDLRP